jgi:hypothetical protein
MFFFKKTKVVIDCFTNSSAIYNYSPIQQSNKFIPNWFKDIPLSYRDGDNFLDYPTIRTCSGFLNLYNQGLMLPLWSDLKIQIKDNLIRWQFSDKITEISTHSSLQRGSYLPESEYYHLKIQSPWLFSCKDDIQWTFNSPTWNQQNPNDYFILPGIVDYKYQTETNINIMINHKIDRTIDIPFNTPMAQIIPITEKKLIVKNHLLSDQEYKHMRDKNARDIKFLGQYRTVKSLIDKKRKCPFGFSK